MKKIHYYVDFRFTSACYHGETDSHSSYYSTLYDCTTASEVLTYDSFIKTNEASLKLNTLRLLAGDKLKEKLDKLNETMKN